MEAVKVREIDKHMRNMTSKLIADQRSSEDGKEGLTAFLDKRKPRWAE